MDGAPRLLVSASRRTDIPAYFGRWFSEALDRGWVDVPNPWNRTVRRVSLRTEDLLGFVFWSRNPRPFLPVLDRVIASGLPVLFHVTLTALPREIEPHIPDREWVVRGFRELALRLPPSALTWRFDPTLPLAGPRGQEELRDRFLSLSEELEGIAGRVALSLLDPYKKIRKRMEKATGVDRDWKETGAREFSSWIGESPFAGRFYWCTEPALESAVPPACLDREILGALGIPSGLLPRAATRPGCLCAGAVDIGAYDTCHGGCLYCYAVRSHEKLQPMPS